MLLLVLATVYIATATEIGVPTKGEYMDTEYLKWPETYQFNATKLTLTNNLEENLRVWKTNESSRVCYNGVVNDIKKLVPGLNGIFRILIRPETSANRFNEIVCRSINNTNNKLNTYELDLMLPQYEEYFIKVGNESIDKSKTTIFELKRKGFKKNIWAQHTDDIGWIPVRYENTIYTEFGAIKVHEIWTFSDFNTDVDDDVFHEGQFNCTTNVIHTEDSVEVTKELLFVDPDIEEHVHHVFNHFKNKFDRKYTNAEEHELRRNIFLKNMREIVTSNRHNINFKLGVNQFSDRNTEELQKNLGLKTHPEENNARITSFYNDSIINTIAKKLPKEYDMRMFGLVSPVKDQGDCASCWALTATAVTEGALARASGNHVLNLSPQALLDCTYPMNSDFAGGCEFGDLDEAYTFIKKFGLPTEKEYGPYKSHEDYCRLNNKTKNYKIKDYRSLPTNNLNAIKVAINEHGPIAVRLVLTKPFFIYSGGIYNQSEESCSREKVDGGHGLTLVGYGERNGELFWIAKNTWGVHWGMDGYMLLAARGNYCGIQQLSYVVV